MTSIQAHWFNRNQALPAALTSPQFPLSSRAAGRGSSSSCRLILEGSTLGLCCCRRGRGRGRRRGQRSVGWRGGVVTSVLVLWCWSEPVIVWFLASANWGQIIAINLFTPQLLAIIGYYWLLLLLLGCKSITIIGYYWTTPKTLIIGINRNLLLQLIFLGTNYCN